MVDASRAGRSFGDGEGTAGIGEAPNGWRDTARSVGVRKPIRERPSIGQFRGRLMLIVSTAMAPLFALTLHAAAQERADAEAAKIRDRIQLRGPNIYDSGEVTREVYTVRAVVRSGNSGGPMIRPDGKVVGVVFGAALDDSETGFVLTTAQVKPTLDRAPTLTRPVDTGSCAA